MGRLHLTHAEHSGVCLELGGCIPPRFRDDDSVGAGDVESDAATLQRCDLGNRKVSCTLLFGRIYWGWAVGTYQHAHVGVVMEIANDCVLLV